MLLSIDHIQITIPIGAEKLAREFYCGILGLKEIEKPENRRLNGGFWLVLGSVQVHVGVESGVDRMLTKAHAAYRVTDLEFWRKRMIEHGLCVKDSLAFESAKSIEFRDPFGNRLELIECN